MHERLIQPHQDSDIGMEDQSPLMLGQYDLAFISILSVISHWMWVALDGLGPWERQLSAVEANPQRANGWDKSFHERGAEQFISVSITSCRCGQDATVCWGYW